MSPTVTLTGGLRWDLQTPFSASNDTMSTVTMADVCGMSGLGDGGTYQQVQLLQRRARTGGVVPAVHAADQGHERLQDRLEQLRAAASASRGGRTCRAASCARSSAIPSRRRSAAATRVAYERQGLARVHRHSTAQSRQHAQPDPRPRQRQPGQPPANPGRCSSARPSRLYHGAVPETPTYPDRRSAPNRADSLNALRAGHQDRVGAHVDGQLPALDLARHGGRHPLRRHPRRESVVDAELQHHPRREPDQQRLHQRVQARRWRTCAANNAAGGSRAGSFAYFGAGHRAPARCRSTSRT